MHELRTSVQPVKVAIMFSLVQTVMRTQHMSVVDNH